jgi:FlaA1/EpsC-like NDP-sugar epimerase
MSFDSGSTILLTGGTGSFGKAFIAEALKRFPDMHRLVVYSRDELKKWELQQIFSEKKFPQLRFFLGDVRDPSRLTRALEGIDTVVHAAALKQVPAAEYNPMEFINTNVLGAENVVQACLGNLWATGLRANGDRKALVLP